VYQTVQFPRVMSLQTQYISTVSLAYFADPD
jgi:hypothetical protein